MVSKGSRTGKCVCNDEPQWIQAAAEKGDGRAMYFLAVCLAKGQGTERDLGEAVGWADKSAAAGYKDAEELCDELFTLWETERIEGIRPGKTPSWIPSEGRVCIETTFLYEEKGIYYFEEKKTKKFLGLENIDNLNFLEMYVDYYLIFEDGKFLMFSKIEE